MQEREAGEKSEENRGRKASESRKRVEACAQPRAKNSLAFLGSALVCFACASHNNQTLTQLMHATAVGPQRHEHTRRRSL